MPEGLLSGIRIVDLTTVVVGPSATLRLADHGAEIVKIEPPEGDLLRVIGGPSHSGELSGKFMHFNRAKRFMCLDLKKQAARAAAMRLIETSDVLVSNIRPEALARLGLDAAACRALKPALIHCTITGFGPDGPYRGQPAYDTVLQGATGIAGLAARRDGTPSYVPFLAVDHVVGEITAGTICAALFRRGRTGEGATIEVPMHETMAAFVLKEHLGAATFEPPLGASGDKRVLDPFSRPAATADGWIAITANTDRQATAFLRAIDRAELIDDARFRTVADRYRNASDWFALRSELKRRSSAHWLAVLRAADVPAMPCHTLETLVDDPGLAAAGLVGRAEHPIEGSVKTVRSSVMVDGSVPLPGDLAKPLGWDTVEMLEQLGIAPADIAALVADGAAIDGRRTHRSRPRATDGKGRAP